MPQNPPEHMVLYHADCIDGFGAAWAAWRRLGDGAEYLPVIHGDAPPDVTGRHVHILDFSYKRDVLLAMHGDAASLEVVDHHKTAEENLKGLDFCVFDMNHSGAVLAWKHFHPDTPTPELLAHVEDKDLWRWKLSGSAEITCALRGYAFAFDRWSEWADGWDTWRNALIIEGGAILRYQDEVVKGIVASAVEITVAGTLAQGRPFGVAWYEADGRRYYALRGRDSDVDVADVARLFGGGGHAKAAGFSVDVDKDISLEP